MAQQGTTFTLLARGELYAVLSGRWSRVGGEVRSLATAGADVFALGNDAVVYRWDAGRQAFAPIGVGIAQIEAVGDALHALGRDGRTWRFEGGHWAD